MYRLGSWYVPDNENYPQVLETIKLNNFSSYIPITVALDYTKNFNSAIDVGAWIGDSTDLLARVFSNVYAFEANTQTYDCCKCNLKNRTNVEIFNYALSNSNETKEFFNRESSFSGWINTLTEEIITRPTEIATVECRTLDSFDFQNIDLIKIDVDSHEGYVLEGSQEFFSRNSPVVVIEYKPSILIRQSKEMKKPLEMLQDIGYKIISQPSKIDYILIRD